MHESSIDAKQHKKHEIHDVNLWLVRGKHKNDHRTRNNKEGRAHAQTAKRNPRLCV